MYTCISMDVSEHSKFTYCQVPTTYIVDIFSPTDLILCVHIYIYIQNSTHRRHISIFSYILKHK